MKNIIVVDDEEKIIFIVKLYLEKEGFQVFSTTSGIEALNIFSQEHIDLIILDLMLPDLSGEEICRRIRKSSLVPIIMLTAKVDEENIINGFELGADDYINKPFSPRELIARVKAVMRRRSDNKERIFISKDLIVDYDLHEVYVNDEKIALTPIEFNILELFTKYPRRVFPRSEIIDIIYQDDFEGYDRAIDSHIKNLRKKLKDIGKKYIITVHGIGYKFVGENDA